MCIRPALPPSSTTANGWATEKGAAPGKQGAPQRLHFLLKTAARKEKYAYENQYFPGRYAGGLSVC